MTKITQKDIRQNLGLWNYAKIKGRAGLAMPKNALNKIKANYHMGKTKLEKYVESDIKDYKQELSSNIDGKLKDLSAFKKDIRKDKELSKEQKSIYIDEANKKIAKLKSKKVKIKKRGLGIFALGKLAISKFRRIKNEEKAERIQMETKLASDKKLAEAKKVLENMQKEYIEQQRLITSLQEERDKLPDTPVSAETKTPIERVNVVRKPNIQFSTPGVEIEKEPEIIEEVEKPLKLMYIRKPTMKEKWAKALAVGAMAAILFNAHLTCKSKIINKYENNLEYKPPAISQEEKYTEPTVIIVDNNEELDEKTSSTYWDKEAFELGDVVLIDTTKPIYKSAEDSIFQVNGVEHMFKDDDDRIIEAVTYKYVEGDTPKFITVFATEQDSKEKVELLKEKGATLESVLISKTEYSGKGLGNEGFKNIYDVQLKELSKGVSR